MLDSDFIKRKVDLINRDLVRLEEFRDFTVDQMAQDHMRYAALKNYLMEIIGRAVDINQHVILEKFDLKDKTPVTYQDSFLYLPKIDVLPEHFAQKIAGSGSFRNAIVHDYNNLNKYLVYKTIGEAIDQYTQYCQYILEYLDKQTNS